MEPYRYFPGSKPVLISIPHMGTHVPPEILERFTDAAKRLPDTDWHLDILYEFARDLGVHLLMATHSRYVIDLNRAPDNASLYPGRFTTGLCPTTLFDGSPLYLRGQELLEEETAQRLEKYWRPYHDKLQEVLAGFGNGILFDAHSIASQVPTLFEGILPDLNLGTADGTAASAELAAKLLQIGKMSDYSVVLNGRFKGGYITRSYGRPEKGIQAVQLELAQKNYMQEDYPFAYDAVKAGKLQKILQKMIAALLE